MARKGGGAREPSMRRSPRIQAATSALMRSRPYCTCPISTPPCANMVSFTISTVGLCASSCGASRGSAQPESRVCRGR